MRKNKFILRKKEEEVIITPPQKFRIKTMSR